MADLNNTTSAPNADSESNGDIHPGDVHTVPAFEPHSSSVAGLKDRIKQHYDIASDYYYSLWGEHIHHSYFKSPKDTKETGQVNLIELLLEISAVQPSSKVLDVGCGIGGTSRYLARARDCQVTGITISTSQVEIAQRLSLADQKASTLPSTNGDKTGSTNDTAAATNSPSTSNGATSNTPPALFILSPAGGSVSFTELDAEKLDSRFSPESFDVVWITEALSHFPNKTAFFRNAHAVLRNGGRLVLSDWFKAPGLTEEQSKADIQPIEDGMLLPPLCTIDEYVRMAEAAGLRLRKSAACEKGVRDISDDVAKTWDISWSLIKSPSLWAFAISHGRDGLAFLQAFRAMRRGYANGTFRYAVMSFEK